MGKHECREAVFLQFRSLALHAVVQLEAVAERLYGPYHCTTVCGSRNFSDT